MLSICDPMIHNCNAEVATPTYDTCPRILEVGAQVTITSNSRGVDEYVKALRLFGSKNEDFSPIGDFLVCLAYRPGLQNSLYKQTGYLSRLRSNETWDQWLEPKTELGKVASLFDDFRENAISKKKLLRLLGKETVAKANRQAVALLRSLPEPSPDCSLESYLLPVAFSLYVHNPIPLGLHMLTCFTKI